MTARAMSPERWREIDEILKCALACERERRDAFVRDACANDETLRGEVVSLLAAHDAAPADYLEHPVTEVEELRAALIGGESDAAPMEPPVRERTLPAKIAVYAGFGGIVLGLFGGWRLSKAAFWHPPQPITAASDTPPPVVVAPRMPDGALSLVVMDRAGNSQRVIPANRPWTPRFSPDGRRVAYGAFGDGRETSDVWVTDLWSGKTQRITDDDDDSNDPQWSPDGSMLVYSVRAPDGKAIAVYSLRAKAAKILATRPGAQFPSDWRHDGGALLVTEEAGGDQHDILVQPADGSPARTYAATTADELGPRASPDGRWVAYTSDESGRPQVYIGSYQNPAQRVMISRDGGVHPVWRGDGKELYYWQGDALVAVDVRASGDDAPPVTGSPTVLFHAPYEGGVTTMYDVSPDGQRFVIVRHGSQ